MVEVSITITGDKMVMSSFRRLFKKMGDQIGTKAISEIGQELKDRIRARAPVETGFLRGSVNVRKTKDGMLVSVSAPYAMAQETGFTPHAIPIEYMEMHMGNPGFRGSRIKNPTAFVTVKRHTPFVEPALHSMYPVINRILAYRTDRAIRSAFKI